MPIEAELPDGSIVEFEDGTSDQQINQTLIQLTSEMSSQQQSQPQPSMLERGSQAVSEGVSTMLEPARAVQETTGSDLGSSLLDFAAQSDLISGSIPDMTIQINKALQDGVPIVDFIGQVAASQVQDPVETALMTAATAAVPPALGKLPIVGPMARMTAAAVSKYGADLFEDFTGLRTEEKTAGQSASEGFVEQGFAELFSKVLGRYLPQGPADQLAKKTIGKGKEGLIEASRLVDEFSGKSIQRAQEEVLGSRYLTIMQETGGEVFPSQVRSLEEAISRSSQISKGQSAFRKADQELLQKAEQAILDRSVSKAGAKFELDQLPQASKALSDQIVNTRDSINKQIGRLNPVVSKGKDSPIPVEGLSKIMSTLELDISESIRSKLTAPELALDTTAGTDLIDKSINIVRQRLIDQEGALKSQVSLQDIINIQADIDTKIISAFQQGSPAQGVASKVGGEINKILDSYLEAAVGVEGLSKEGQDAVVAYLGRRSLARDIKQIDDLPIAKLIGSTERLQDSKAKGVKSTLNKVFENESNYKQTRAFLAKYNPEMIDTMDKAFTTSVLSNMYSTSDSAKYILDSKKISNFINNNPDKVQVMRAVKGDEYVERLTDIAFILRARESVPLGQVRPEINAIEKISNGLKDIGLATLTNHKLRRASAALSVVDATSGMFKAIDEEKLLKSLQGARGQELFEEMLKTDLADPKAYSLYLSMMREADLPAASIDAFSSFAKDAAASTWQVMQALGSAASAQVGGSNEVPAQ